jgi:hypothetical protein
LDKNHFFQMPRQPFPGRVQSLLVSIKAKQPAAGAQSFRYQQGMASAAGSGVDIRAVRPNVQRLDTGAGQHGNM